MGSLIDEIAAAEQRAEAIRQEAAAAAREAIALAQADAEATLAGTDVSEREKTRAALAAAERDGGDMAEQMLHRMAQEAETLCLAAQARVDDAASYLVKKAAGDS